MIRTLLLFYLLYQGQATKIEGKLDIEKDLASIFRELISQYLNDDAKNTRKDININQVLDSFQNFANNQPSKDFSDVQLERYKNIEMTSKNPNEKDRRIGPIKPSVSKKAKANKHRKNKTKSKKKRRTTTKGISDSQDVKHIKSTTTNSKKQKSDAKKPFSLPIVINTNNFGDKNKETLNDTKKEDMSNITKIDDNLSYQTSQEDKTDSDNTNPREKTVLEEIMGREQIVHLYGKHEENDDLPLNNIKV